MKKNLGSWFVPAALIVSLTGCSSAAEVIELTSKTSDLDPSGTTGSEPVLSAEDFLSAEAACIEAKSALDQLTMLTGMVADDAEAAIESGGGAQAADDAVRKYSPEFERIGVSLLALNIEDEQVEKGVTRLGEAQLAFAANLEEGLFSSGDFDTVTDESVFAAVEVEGVCGK